MMGTPVFENLDFACAKAGKEISERPSKELEKLITDALAVLEEQGVYALFLFLKARGGNEAGNVAHKLHDFLKLTPRLTPLLPDNGDIFESLQKLAGSLDDLLLARDLLRQSLVYARYHARLREEERV